MPVLAAIQLASGTTAYASATLHQGLEWAAAVGVLALVCAMDRSEVRSFRRWMLWFSFALTVVALPQFFTSGGRIFWFFQEIPGSVGPFPNRNHWAAFIELMLPIAIYRMVKDRRTALLYAVMTGAMYGSVTAGASRAGSILCTIELLVVPLFALPRGIGRLRVMKAVASVIVVAALFACISGPGALLARMNEPAAYRERHAFLLTSLAMIRDRPWQGFGIGTWSTVYPQYALIDPGGVHVNEAHNDWAQWAVEGGLPIPILMAGVAIWILRHVRSAPWALGLVFVLIHAGVDYPFQRQALTGWFVALLGLLAQATRPDRQKGYVEDLSPYATAPAAVHVK